jgi:hypothetical protein
MWVRVAGQVGEWAAGWAVRQVHMCAGGRAGEQAGGRSGGGRAGGRAGGEMLSRIAQATPARQMAFGNISQMIFT